MSSNQQDKISTMDDAVTMLNAAKKAEASAKAVIEGTLNFVSKYDAVDQAKQAAKGAVKAKAKADNELAAAKKLFTEANTKLSVANNDEITAKTKAESKTKIATTAKKELNNATEKAKTCSFWSTLVPKFEENEKKAAGEATEAKSEFIVKAICKEKAKAEVLEVARAKTKAENLLEATQKAVLIANDKTEDAIKAKAAAKIEIDLTLETVKVVLNADHTVPDDKTTGAINEAKAAAEAHTAAKLNTQEKKRSSEAKTNVDTFPGTNEEDADDEEDDMKSTSNEVHAEVVNDDDEMSTDLTPEVDIIKPRHKSPYNLRKRASTKRSRHSVSPSKRRPAVTAPTTMEQVKDETVRRKFEIAARKVKELQFQGTWEDKQDRLGKPKCQHFMFTHDEMIKEPKKAVNERFFRDDGQGQLLFLVPDDFDPKVLGPKLQTAGREMAEGKNEGENWKIIANRSIKQYHEEVFGDASWRSQGDNKQAKKSKEVLGDGYEN